MRIDPEAPWLRALGDSFLEGIHEEALRRDPRDRESLEFLAHAYTRRGKIAAGLGLDRRLVALRPADALARYNLACSLALAGRREEALDTLEIAVLLGYGDAEHARGDGDLESVRGNPRFEEILGTIGTL